MAKTQKTLEQQIECAQARAKTAKIDLLSISADGEGNVTWAITGERDSNVWYHVTYGADNHLVCECPAQCVCKHIGKVLLRNVNYTRTSQPATPPAAPAVAAPTIEQKMDALGESLRQGFIAKCRRQHEEHEASLARYRAEQNAIETTAEIVEDAPEQPAPATQSTEAEQIADFPMLMDIAAEVAIVEAEMALAGFYWDEGAQTWLPMQQPVALEVAR